MAQAPVRRSFRRTPVRLWLTAMASGFLLIAVSMLFSAGPDGTDSPTLLQQLIVAPFAGLMLWITVGVFRQGVWSDPHGISVRNVFRSYRASWAEVEAIERPPPYGKMGNAGLQIVLKSGERISAALYGAGPFSRPTHADAVVEALRSDLERYRRT
jgi:hypothetical protein